jgi:ferritin
MISKTVLNEMNEQIKHELYSSYLYLSMSAHLGALNFTGMASWMRVQAQEELEHALKFYDFIQDRGGRPVLQAIDQPPAEFGTPLDVFTQAYEHEQKVTARIHHIYALADKEKDFASLVFLNWFVDEQVEEEKNASQIVETLKMIGDKGNALFMLDHRLGERGEEEED